ncbi:unnamed protein product [Meganyctiphanes norvegica]|uniref:Fork-head domain-containing protein n=1 Tax=Meganyctiphanes norvegica TaxID=48144 RepID=A0AAV2Q177_MEGNR
MDMLSCRRESSLSPPSVVAPVAIKPSSGGIPVPETLSPMEQHQRLLAHMALAERIRIASAMAMAPKTQQMAMSPPTGMNNPDMMRQQPLGIPLMPGHLMGLMQQQQGGLVAHMNNMQAPQHMGPFGSPMYSLYNPYRGLVDPRMLFHRVPEEPKPQHSYIGLISQAILSSPEKKLILSDIYQHILDNHAYFRNRGTGWRNSIRHNLSLNDCFMKAGRATNGKGHYWAIHPANVSDFARGDYRRRRAQRKVRRHLGLQVEDDSDLDDNEVTPASAAQPTPPVSPHASSKTEASAPGVTHRPRPYDMLSLLAPDVPRQRSPLRPEVEYSPERLQHNDHGHHLNFSSQQALLLSLRSAISPVPSEEDEEIDVTDDSSSEDCMANSLSKPMDQSTNQDTVSSTEELSKTPNYIPNLFHTAIPIIPEFSMKAK